MVNFSTIKRKRWEIGLALAGVCGVILRVIYVNDMEYKEDEQYNFTQTQLIGTTQPWPWYGIPSGVYLVNPGMSIWVFAILAKLFGIHQPTQLATALQLFALLGMSLVVPFALKLVSKKEQKTWLWAFALAMVNPFLVLYQRKLWPEPFLPFFTLLTLWGWWKRRFGWGAFLWGMVGAWLGQIHMSGFFFAGALFLWTALFPAPHEDGDSPRKAQPTTAWGPWFLGSCLGALPLIPWAIYVIQHPVRETMSAGWNEIIQLKYWTFWFTDPTGLHLGNPLGLLRGPSNWDQISDFVRYPVLSFGSTSQPTYIVGLAHLVALLSVLAVFGQGLYSAWKSVCSRSNQRWARLKSFLIGSSSNTAFVQNSSLLGCGILLTLTGVIIRRYYMAVTFPLEFICLIRIAQPDSWLGRKCLIALWIAELVISAGFVNYIHVNQGSIYGDYGPAYHLIAPTLPLMPR